MAARARIERMTSRGCSPGAHAGYRQQWTQTGSPTTDKLFTGHQRHGRYSGLYYAGARFYAADLGRFLSADPIVPGAGDPQALNRYAYVRNNR